MENEEYSIEESYELSGIYKKPLSEPQKCIFSQSLNQLYDESSVAADSSPIGFSDGNKSKSMKFRYIFSSTAQLERLDSNGNEIAFVLLSFKEFEKQEVKMKFLTHIVAALNANKSVRICFGLEERSLKVVGEKMTPDEICHFKVDVSRSLLLHLRPSLWDDEFRILFRSVYDAHGIQIENLYVVEVQIDSTVFSTVEGLVLTLDRGNRMLVSINEMREKLAKKVEKERKWEMEELQEEVEYLTNTIKLLD